MRAGLLDLGVLGHKSRVTGWLLHRAAWRLLGSQRGGARRWEMSKRRGGGGTRSAAARASRSQEVARGLEGVRAEVTSSRTRGPAWFERVSSVRLRKLRAFLPHAGRAQRSGTSPVGKMVKPKYKGRSTINPSNASTNPGTVGWACGGWGLEEAWG